MKKIVIGCLSVTGVILLLIIAVVAFWIFRELPLLDATVSLPLEVQMESTAAMVVTVTNTHKTAVILDSIDIDDSFLSGFQIVSIDPKPKDTSHVSMLKQRSWDFGRSISPGGSLSVTFMIRPVTEGRFSGEVEVCNPNQDFKTLLVDVIVKKQISNKPPEAASEPAP